MDIRADEYLAQCKRRFGAANPERMQVPVWEWMVRRKHNPYAARKMLGLDQDDRTCESPPNPEWCFDRMGMTVTTLPDGRRISVGGEHEDWYDPDFCIYNDVVVESGGEIAIYGYPRAVFPPTDFHTATLIGPTLWLIGSVGYGEDQGAETQVLTLDAFTYRIESARFAGDSPGWISRHRAVLLDDGVTIEISRGDTRLADGDRSIWRKNVDVFRLNTRTALWTKVTDTSSWHQYEIEYEQDIRDLAEGEDLGWYTGEILSNLGHRVEVAPLPSDPEAVADERIHTVWVRDIPVRVNVYDFQSLRVIVEGNLPEQDRRELIDGIVALLASTRRQVVKVTQS